MGAATDVVTTIVAQFQKPTLAFLIAGMGVAALGARMDIPKPVYSFIVTLLLLKIGLGAGIAIREADLVLLMVPAALAAGVGVAIVGLGGWVLCRAEGVSIWDGMATAGLFGAVSASTLAAAMAVLDSDAIPYEGYIAALYPFMDLAALLTAIIAARLVADRRRVATDGTATITLQSGGLGTGMAREIIVDTLRSGAICALMIGLAIGSLARPEAVYVSFYEPLFAGFLSLLMFIMGKEAWTRLAELKGVALAYLAYGLTAPLVNGALGFGAGLLAHHWTGFSPGGVVLLAVMAASSSDVSGPPTLRAALPEANPSAYVGVSTGLGTPVAILSIPLWMALVDLTVGL